MPFGVTQAKSIFTSKTFWGALFALTSVLFPHTYEHLMAAIGINDPALISGKIVGFFAVMFAIYGRLAATQPVTLTGGPVLVPLPFSASQADGSETMTTRRTAVVETTTKIMPVPADQHAQIEPVSSSSVNVSTEKWPELNQKQ